MPSRGRSKSSSYTRFQSPPREPDLGHLSADRQVLIKRAFEIDPLVCPECRGVMKVVAFMEGPQADVMARGK